MKPQKKPATNEVPGGVAGRVSGRVSGGQQNPLEDRDRQRKPNQQQRLQALTAQIEEVKANLEEVFAHETMDRNERIEVSTRLSTDMHELIAEYERVSGPNTWFKFTDEEREALEEMNTVGGDLQREIDTNKELNANRVEQYRLVNPRFLDLWRSAEESTDAYHKCLELASQKFDLLPDDQQTIFVRHISVPLNDAIAMQTANDARAILEENPAIDKSMLADRYVRCTLHAGNTQNACHALFPVINVLRDNFLRPGNEDHENYSTAVKELCLAYVNMKINELDSFMAAADLMVDTVNMHDIPLIAKTIVKILFIKASVATITSMLPDPGFAKILSQDIFQVASHISPFVLLPYASRETLSTIKANIGKLIRVIIGSDEAEQLPGDGAAPIPPPTEKALISELFDRVINADKERTRRLIMGSSGLRMPESPLDITSVIKCIQYLIRWFCAGSIMAFKDGVGNINDLFMNVGSFLRTGIKQVPRRLTEAVWDTALERVSQRGTTLAVNDLLYGNIRRFLPKPERPELSVGRLALEEVLSNLDRKTLSEGNLKVFTALNLQQYPDQPYRHLRPEEGSSMQAMGNGPTEFSQDMAAAVAAEADDLGPHRDETDEVYIPNAGGGVDILRSSRDKRYSGQVFAFGPRERDSANEAADQRSAIANQTRNRQLDNETEQQNMARFAARFGEYNRGGKAHTYKRSSSKHTARLKSSGLKQKSKKNKRQSRRKLRRASSRKGRK